MMTENYGEYWWGVLPGPSELYSQIYQEMTKGRPIILYGRGPIPFANQLRERLHNEFYSLQTYDEANEALSKGAPAKILIAQSFVPLSLRRQYRSYMDPASFLAEHHLLKGYQFFCHLEDRDQLNDWIGMLDKLSRSQTTAETTFLLEFDGEPLQGVPNSICAYRWEDYVSPLDIQFMAVKLLAEYGIKGPYSEYLSLLVSALAGKNAELCVQLCGHFALKERDQQLYSTDLPEEITSEQLERAINEAQLRYCFPIVERCRLDIIERYRQALENCMPITVHINGGLESIYDVEELSLGNLLFLSSSNSHAFSLIPEELERVRFLRDCRNALAHSHLISRDGLKRLTLEIE